DQETAFPQERGLTRRVTDHSCLLPTKEVPYDEVSASHRAAFGPGSGSGVRWSRPGPGGRQRQTAAVIFRNGLTDPAQPAAQAVSKRQGLLVPADPGPDPGRQEPGRCRGAYLPPQPGPVAKKHDEGQSVRARLASVAGDPGRRHDHPDLVASATPPGLAL